MRPEILNPIKDKPRFDAAAALVRDIFQRYEDGDDCDEPLARLSRLAGKPITALDIDDAVELIEPEIFVQEWVLGVAEPPDDMTEAELLELVRRVRANDGDGLQIAYWVKCLEAATGDPRISYLLSAPELYTQDGRDWSTLSHEAVLATAREAGRRIA